MKVISHVNEILSIDPIRDGKSVSEVVGISIDEILAFNAVSSGHQVKAVIFEKGRSEIKVETATGTTCSIEARIETGQKKLDLVELSVSEALGNRLDYLPSERKDKVKSSIFALIKESKVFGLYLDQELLGVLVLVDVKEHFSIDTLISWIWIKDALSDDMKDSMRRRILRVLLENGRERIIASVYASNVRSLYFFLKLEFHLKWIYVE